MRKRDLTPLNNKGEAHGYWTKYFSNGHFYYRGNCINGKYSGYWEWGYETGEVFYKRYYII